MSNTSLHTAAAGSIHSTPSSPHPSARRSTPRGGQLEGRPASRDQLGGRSTPKGGQLDGRLTPRAQLENRVSKWIDQEISDLNRRRVSNSTLYEDIDDVLEYFSEFKDDSPPPPLPPRFLRSSSLTLSSTKRKNLSQHLGLDLEELNQSTRDLASAQRIALAHLQSSSKCSSSKKDLNKFLGINESPVKLRKNRRRQQRRDPQNRNSFSFMETFMGGKFFPGKAGRRGTEPEPQPMESSLDRRRRLGSFSDAESYDKSRSSSFSSTGSASAFSTGSGSSSTSSAASLGSFSHSNSVSRLFQSAVSSDLVSSLRLTTNTKRRRNSIQSVFDINKPPAAAAEVPTQHDDIAEFVESGLPIIPFKSRPPVAAARESAAHQPNLERAGHSLDAVISFARLELSQGRRQETMKRRQGRKVWDESVYMDMSSPNTSGEIYMDMDVLRPSHKV